MKKTDLKILKAKSLAELTKMVKEKKVELDKFSANLVGGKEKNLKKAKSFRRDIAQIRTLVTQMGIVKEESKK